MVRPVLSPHSLHPTPRSTRCFFSVCGLGGYMARCSKRYHTLFSGSVPLISFFFVFCVSVNVSVFVFCYVACVFPRCSMSSVWQWCCHFFRSGCPAFLHACMHVRGCRCCVLLVRPIFFANLSTQAGKPRVFCILLRLASLLMSSFSRSFSSCVFFCLFCLAPCRPIRWTSCSTCCSSSSRTSSTTRLSS